MITPAARLVNYIRPPGFALVATAPGPCGRRLSDPTLDRSALRPSNKRARLWGLPPSTTGPDELPGLMSSRAGLKNRVKLCQRMRTIFFRSSHPGAWIA